MPKVFLVGLGPGGRENLTLGALEVLQRVTPLFLRTEKHPAVSLLKEKGIAYRSFDHLYLEEKNYEAMYESMALQVMEAARAKGQAAYALPGHPLVAERSVHILMKAAAGEGMETEVKAGGSFMEAVVTALELEPSRGVTFLDALAVDSLCGLPHGDLIIYQLFNTRTASRVKLKLMEYLPDDHPVTLVRKAGVLGEEELFKTVLYQLDRQRVDHLTSLHVSRAEGGLDKLLSVMEFLRSDRGCPWDREQDFFSLRPYVIEEAYEVVEAVNSGDEGALVEELGDLLLQVVFYAQMGRERGAFNFADITRTITDKIIRRHPHVFSSSFRLSTPKEVVRTWDEIKEGETAGESCLQDVGRGMPALVKAFKLQEKAGKLGFDWPCVDGAWDKVLEELEELKQVYNSGDSGKIEDELGDLFFALVNVARFLNVDPEVALTGTNDKFCQRFAYIEARVKEGGGNFHKYNLEKLDHWWEKAKKSNKYGKKKGS